MSEITKKGDGPLKMKCSYVKETKKEDDIVWMKKQK
jgi:hypothetical protein